MALTDLQIVNFALIKLGDKTLTALTDNTKAAVIMGLYIDQARRATLRSHPWKFACDRALLYPLSTPTPPFDYNYYFDLPDRCLRILRVNDNDVQYVLEQNKILCNETSLQIRYIRDIFNGVEPSVDYTMCDPLFIEGFATYLAWCTCYAILQNNDLKESLWKDFAGPGGIIAKARFVDATEQPPDILRAEDLLLARIDGTNSGMVRDPGT